MFLTDQELAVLTGYRRGKEQCDWLTKNGWVFVVEAHGKPRVAIEYWRYKMGVTQETPQRWRLKLA